MTARLSQATLDTLPASIERPGYDRAGIEAGIVHLGPGVFHRAHQAVWFDDLLRAGDRRWGVIGASLRSIAAHDAMTPQDGLYSLVVGDRVRVIGAIRALLTPADPIVARLAAPETRIVTLTVTARGYRPGEPAPRLIAEALALRRERGLDPFTAISCDDLPGNGAALRAAVLAAAGDPALADWIRERGAFPQTLADRIAGPTQEADIERLAARTGLIDRATVTAEPFRHWVIEDWFAGERPDFEAVGVQLAFDIGPWQEAKARLLGGARLMLALLGGLAGYDYIHEIFAEPAVRRAVAALWDEAETGLSPPPGLDVAAYRDALAARFADPALEQRNRHAAADGAGQLGPALLDAAAARLRHNQPIEALALGVAAWMRWQSRHTDVGYPFVVVDPLAGETARALVGAGDPTARAKALLKLEAIFPPALAADTRFEAAVTRQLKRLSEDGALRAVQRFVAELDA